MVPRSRRALLKAATALVPIGAAGCLSTDPLQSKTTPHRSTATSSSPNASTGPGPDNYGPWKVTVDNNLDDAGTVTIEVRTSDGALHEQVTATVDGDGGENVVTVTEPGPYTLTATTDFGEDRIDFDACKLNSDAIVELYRSDGEKTLTVSQRHTDPGTGTTLDDPYSCDDAS